MTSFIARPPGKQPCSYWLDFCLIQHYRSDYAYFRHELLGAQPVSQIPLSMTGLNIVPVENIDGFASLETPSLAVSQLPLYQDECAPSSSYRLEEELLIQRQSASWLPSIAAETCPEVIAQQFSSDSQLAISPDFGTGGIPTMAFTEGTAQSVFEAPLTETLRETSMPSHSLHSRLLSTAMPEVNTDTGSSQPILRCPYLSCYSKAHFSRQSDLRKHYISHLRLYYCRVLGCGQNGYRASPGFPTAKDRNRHERGHNPSIRCEKCSRLFSRHDNMRDHQRKMHGDS